MSRFSLNLVEKGERREMFSNVCVCMLEKEGERERERERERGRERERDRQTDRRTDRERERDRERNRQTDRPRKRLKAKNTDRRENDCQEKWTTETSRKQSEFLISINLNAGQFRSNLFVSYFNSFAIVLSPRIFLFYFYSLSLWFFFCRVNEFCSFLLASRSQNKRETWIDWLIGWLIDWLPGKVPILHDDEEIDDENERGENSSSQLVGGHRPVVDVIPRNPIRRDNCHH